MTWCPGGILCKVGGRLAAISQGLSSGWSLHYQDQDQETCNRPGKAAQVERRNFPPYILSAGTGLLQAHADPAYRIAHSGFNFSLCKLPDGPPPPNLSNLFNLPAILLQFCFPLRLLDGQGALLCLVFPPFPNDIRACAAKQGTL